MEEWYCHMKEQFGFKNVVICCTIKRVYLLTCTVSRIKQIQTKTSEVSVYFLSSIRFCFLYKNMPPKVRFVDCFRRSVYIGIFFFNTFSENTE